MKKYYHIQNKSFSELGVSSHKELWDKVKETHDGLSVDTVVKFNQLNKGFHAILSSAKEDRHGDVVHQKFDLKSFKENPVVLDSHNYGSIASIIGKVTKISIKNGNLEGDIEFMLGNPLGALAHKMVEDGFLNAVSIGFIPKDFNEKGEILKSELLELSVVSVPAQAEALFKNYEEENECPYKETEKDDCEENCEEGATEDQEEDKNLTEEQIERLEDDQDDVIEVEKGEEVDKEEETEEEKEEETEEVSEKTASDTLRLVVKELQKMREDNFQERRRKLYKKIREGLSQ